MVISTVYLQDGFRVFSVCGNAESYLI